MSSSSDGPAERHSLPSRSRFSASRKLATVSKRRSFSSTEPSSPHSIESPGTLSGVEVDRYRDSEPPASKRQRVPKGSGFLLDDGAVRKASTRQSSRQSSEHNGTPAGNKGKARALGRSPLGDNVMNNGEAESPTIISTAPDQRATEAQGINYTKPRNLIADTNQAQIVNLALNLSEGRRRQFSSNRISSLDSSNIRSPSRIVSSPTNSTPQSGSFQRYLDSPRTYSPSDFSNYGIKNGTMQSTESTEHSSFDNDSPLRTFGLPDIQAGEFYPSEATLMRVQKAKEAIELSYQYRRLLQYLPALPAPSSKNREQHARKPSKIELLPLKLGRTYNPLQYIRNRKIRRRENRPLNAEGHGWKQVDAVRERVDLVSEEPLVPVGRANDFSLPDFKPLNKGFELSKQDSVPGSPKSITTPSKEDRPRVEWMVDSWNLLADAYWQEQEDHRSLIEDARSQKIFPPPLAAPIDLRKDAIRSSARRSMSIPRIGHERSSSVDVDHGAIGRNSIERGRKTHSRQHSVDSNRDYSGSRDRKGGWRRFIGSQSTSGAEDDYAPGSTRMPSNRRSQLTAKERHDNMILEKQLKALMAKETDRFDYQHDMSNGHSDDQSFPGMSSRPSSPEGDFHPGSLSTKTSQDLASHLGLVERSREMQPRRFSINQASGNELEPKLKSPKIEINVSPPRSRSRHARPLSNISTSRIPSDTEEASKLSPRSAHRERKSIDGGRQLKDSNSGAFESRLRGLLEGTKITDAVNSPVTKIGDSIRKQEQNLSDMRQDISNVENLMAVGDVADNDDRTTRLNEKYRPAELPVFTSPFRGRQRGTSYESKRGSIVLDRLEVVPGRKSDRRSLSRSHHRSTDPSPSPSVSQSLRKDQTKDSLADNQRRHAVTGMGGGVESAHPGQNTDQSLWPSKDSLYYINITQRLLAPIQRKIQRRDILVLRTMSQCALVTASSVLHQRQYNSGEIAKSPSHRNLHASTQQKLLTSHELLKNAVQGSSNVEEALNALTQTTFPEISTKLLSIEAHVSETLTPSVRTAGDHADKLSAELATTRTLEVKKLNDELDLISRRRRRKFRWFRRGVYWMLEWTLLGAMWWAWLIVVCFRLTRGTIRATIATIRWLLWL